MNKVVFRRVTRIVPLSEVGCIVEKVDSEIPNLYTCLCKVLMPQMLPDCWETLAKSLPLSRKLKSNTMIFIMTEKSFTDCNCLVSNVHTIEERSNIIQLLYSDDTAFNPLRLPRIENEIEFNRIKSGEISFLNKDNVYVVKTVTTKLAGKNHNHRTVNTDFIFYIPSSKLYVSGDVV